MKTVKQLREEYEGTIISCAPDKLMLEGRVNAMKSVGKAVPSPNEMPAMLMFRRVSYKMFPGHQTVALYYSKLVNKYLSIPFGPDGNLNLSEAVIHDDLTEGTLKTVAKTIAGGLTGAAHGAVRGAMKGATIAADPGFAIGGVVGGVHGAVKGAKAAYQKAKDQENMEEDWQKANRKDRTDGLSRETVKLYRSEHPGSNLQTAVTEKNPTGKRASRRKSFCSRMGGMKKRLTKSKNARDPNSPINKALRRWNCEESFLSKLEEMRLVRQQKLDENLPALARSLGGYALNKAIDWATSGNDDKKDKKDSDKPKDDTYTTHKGSLLRDKPGGKTYSSWKMAKPSTSSYDARLRAATEKDIQAQKQQTRSVSENKISDIRKMIDEGTNTLDIGINGRTVTLNTGMAKRILEVYDSVNTKNKKIVESMLNEDLESFKKLLNFSIKA